MKAKKIPKESAVRYSTFYAALAFSVFTFIFFLIKGSYNRAFMAILTVFYIFIPSLLEKTCKFRLQPTLYVFVIFYAVCPLLGFSYDFYYNFSWWDDILHASAGILFALLGAHIPKILSKDSKPSVALCAFSAFFFSVAVAGLWELIEFFSDSYFDTDMQKDTLLLAMRPSYLLSEKLGAPVGELLPITDMQIIMNGTTIEYYIDIGLIDSMKDILVETIGAGIYLLLYSVGGGKHFNLVPLSEPETKNTTAPSAGDEPQPQTAAQIAVTPSTTSKMQTVADMPTPNEALSSATTATETPTAATENATDETPAAKNG